VSDRPVFFSRLVLPVSWERLDRAPSAEQRAAAARADANILDFLLHEIDQEAAARVADERLAEALAPLRIKLDIAIEMLRRLSYRDVVLPPSHDVELGLTRLAWHASSALQIDDWLRVRIFFDATFLEPIELYGQVASCVADADGGCSVQVELAEIPEDTGEALTRVAFLTQRRQLAHRPAQTATRWTR
jgi:hypothetical protein